MLIFTSGQTGINTVIQSVLFICRRWRLKPDTQNLPEKGNKEAGNKKADSLLNRRFKIWSGTKVSGTFLCERSESAGSPTWTWVTNRTGLALQLATLWVAHKKSRLVAESAF